MSRECLPLKHDKFCKALFFQAAHPCCTVWVLLWLLFQTGLAITPGIDQQCELYFVIVVTLVT